MFLSPNFAASSKEGGLTLATTSAFHAWSTLTNFAPAASYELFENPLSTPAFVSISTEAPALISFVTLTGANATLPSPAIVSFGT